MNVVRLSRFRPRMMVGLFLAVWLGTLGATVPAAAQSVPQGYQSDKPLQKGMIVRLKTDNGNAVQMVNQQEEAKVFGVVVSSSDAPVSLSSGGPGQEVFVANSGTYEVLVSNQNGPVRVGDYVAISSLDGVGMRADTKREFVLGKARSAFDGKMNVNGNAMLKTGGGQQTVQLGRVSVQVAVAHNPSFMQKNEAGVPQLLSDLAEVVTDKPVTAFRIYASAAVVIICLIIAGVIIFSGVRTGMTAIGRNPLAKKSIRRNLLQVILMALIVFVIGLIAVYLLLRI